MPSRILLVALVAACATGDSTDRPDDRFIGETLLGAPPATDFDGNLDGDLTWITPIAEGGDPENHRHPVMGRLGTDADPEVYVVGYEQPLWGNYRIMLYDGDGNRISTYQGVYGSHGVYWGDRNDSLRTGVDGDLTWVTMGQDSNQLNLFRMTWE